MNTQQEIYDYFKAENENIVINWNGRLEVLSECSWRYFILLLELSEMIEYRTQEHIKKTRRISSNNLLRMINEKYTDDLIYAAYNEILRDHKQQLCQIYKTMIGQESPGYQHDLRHDLRLYIAHTVALHEAFISFIGKDLPLKVALLLQEVLYLLCTRAKNTYNAFLDEERISDRGSDNQKKSDKKEQRLEALKLHPKYPELVKTMDKYLQTGKGKDQRILNTLITEITGIEHSTTRKNYREIILKEYTESQKQQ